MIYFDNSATTRICEEALLEYVRLSRELYGNPSSLHSMGHDAEKVMNEARQTILSTLGARDCELVFTASGSEGNNLAIIGRALSKERYLKGSKIITTDGEHASVNAPLERLEAMGFLVKRIPTKGGRIDMEALEAELTPDLILATFMMVNNETGALYDIAAASRLIKSRLPSVPVHVDATQSYMKIPFTKKSIGADMITVSSHKIEGPKGVGALIIDKMIIKERGLSPLTLGGGQEGGLRSGTENLPGIGAFATAARLGAQRIEEVYSKTEALRASLIGLLREDRFSGNNAIDMTLPQLHAPHILNITLPGIKSETMLHFLSSKGIFVSSGSACSSNSKHVSSALIAYGRTVSEADRSIRVSLSWHNTEAELKAFSDALYEGITKLVRSTK